MSDYKDGMELTFKPAHENTGGVTDRKLRVMEVPDWVQERMCNGDLVGFESWAGGIRWSINGQPVTEPKDSL